jgi:Recombination endonuclease VII
MSANDQHDRHMQQRYGLLPGQYRAMLDEQGGRCFICGGTPRANRRLVLDHDHQTGEPRGLLCGACNTFLARAETYLGRREPDGMWPRPPSHGLWVDGELWTWRPRTINDLDPEEYRAVEYQSEHYRGAPDHGQFPWWIPRWQLTPPWRLRAAPEDVRAARERREHRRYRPSPADDPAGQDRPPSMIVGTPAPHDRPADAVATRVSGPPSSPQEPRPPKIGRPASALDPPPSSPIRRHRPPGAGKDSSPAGDREPQGGAQ